MFTAEQEQALIDEATEWAAANDMKLESANIMLNRLIDHNATTHNGRNRYTDMTKAKWLIDYIERWNNATAQSVKNSKKW